MSKFDPVVHTLRQREKVDFIVPERIREACNWRGLSYEEAAKLCNINKVDFGLYANGHKDIPQELIFGLQKGLHFPKEFFYYVEWQRV